VRPPGSSDEKVSLKRRSAQAVARTMSRARWFHGSELHFPVLHLHKRRSDMRERTRAAGSWLPPAGRPMDQWHEGARPCAGLPFPRPDPNLLEEMTKTDYSTVAGMVCSVRRVREEKLGMARDMAAPCKVQVAVSKPRTAVSLPRDVRGVRHHQDGVAAFA